MKNRGPRFKNRGLPDCFLPKNKGLIGPILSLVVLYKTSAHSNEWKDLPWHKINNLISIISKYANTLHYNIFQYTHHNLDSNSIQLNILRFKRLPLVYLWVYIDLFCIFHTFLIFFRAQKFFSCKTAYALFKVIYKASIIPKIRKI